VQKKKDEETNSAMTRRKAQLEYRLPQSTTKASGNGKKKGGVVRGGTGESTASRKRGVKIMAGKKFFTPKP